MLVISRHAIQLQFLAQVVQCIQETGAPKVLYGSSCDAHNAWYKACDLIYSGVASKYHRPINEAHFKMKIIDIWVGLEAQAPGENHCRELAMEQYNQYKLLGRIRDQLQDQPMCMRCCRE